METPTVDDGNESNAWRMFRIMGEFANGFQALAQMPRALAIFGSARTPVNHPYYHAAQDIAKHFSARGIPVITGGGPGIMEAGNRGAKEGGAQSIGLCIELPFEQSHNPYITLALDFHYFFVRKVMFIKHTAAVIIMPGGFGTMDEFWETLTLVQTQKISPIPVILYGRSFWQGLLAWVKEQMEDEHHYISPGDLELVSVCDSPEEVFAALHDLQPEQVDIGNDLP